MILIIKTGIGTMKEKIIEIIGMTWKEIKRGLEGILVRKSKGKINPQQLMLFWKEKSLLVGYHIPLTLKNFMIILRNLEQSSQ